ncbi:uncharacterized protein METZ01_LOCUS513700, partial [marine metagenome]
MAYVRIDKRVSDVPADGMTLAQADGVFVLLSKVKGKIH